MKYKRKSAGVPAVMLAAALPVGAVHADTATEEIQITAPRVAKELERIPQGVSVVTEEQIQRGLPQLTLDESLNRVPGLFMQNRHNFAQALRISIRGFGARSGFGIRGIKLLVDGVPATLPDGQGNVDEIDLGSTERIEVIRGPAASLYGASTGGVINVLTEEATDQPFLNARFSAGAHGYRQYQVKTGGQWQRLNYTISAGHLDLDGYRDNSYIERNVLNTRLRFDIDDTSDLTLTVNLIDIPEMGDPGALTAAEVVSNRRAANPSSLTYDGSEGRQQQRTSLSYRKAFGAHHEVKLRTYFAWLDFDNKLPFPGSTALSNGGQVHFDRFYAGGGAQYTFDAPLGGHANRFTVGVDVDQQSDERRRYRNLTGGVRGALTMNQEENATTLGVFAQNEFAVTERLELTVGIRYDDVEFDIVDRFLTNNSGDDSGETSFDKVSPMVGLLWSPNEALNVYANYATAFETPTLTEFANPLGGGFNTSLRSQTADSFEFGLKGSLATAIPIDYDFAAFRVEVDNELVPYEQDGFTGRTYYRNAGASTRDGVELAASAELVPGVTFGFAYTFMAAEFDTFRTATDNFDGKRIPGLPRHQLFAELKYRHDSGFYGAWDILHVGGFFADNANTAAQQAYQVSSLRLGYEGQVGSWIVAPFVGVSNLFDAAYNSNVRINASASRYFEPAPGQNVYGGLSVRYAFR
ncbi:MAG: TonB-dependent receptor [Gammaproteobacteria bacterium]|nr:TonB-dependent receptor [Gammaproteobacteria bacterium]